MNLKDKIKTISGNVVVALMADANTKKAIKAKREAGGK